MTHFTKARHRLTTTVVFVMCLVTTTFSAVSVSSGDVVGSGFGSAFAVVDTYLDNVESGTSGAGTLKGNDVRYCRRGIVEFVVCQ